MEISKDESDVVDSMLDFFIEHNSNMEKNYHILDLILKILRLSIYHLFLIIIV